MMDLCADILTWSARDEPYLHTSANGATTVWRAAPRLATPTPAVSLQYPTGFPLDRGSLTPS